MATGFSASCGSGSSPFSSSNASFGLSINELNLEEDSDEDVVASDDPINRLFGQSDSEDKDFLGFSDGGEECVDESSTDNDEVAEPSSKKARKEPSPPGWNMGQWKSGDKKLQELPHFAANPGINVDIPEDADELYDLYISKLCFIYLIRSSSYIPIICWSKALTKHRFWSNKHNLSMANRRIANFPFIYLQFLLNCLLPESNRDLDNAL